MSETVVWFSDEDGLYTITVAGATVASGSCVANVVVTSEIPIADFFAGDNVLVISATNANGTGSANVTIVRQGGPPPPESGLCWSGPVTGELPREEYYADPLANRLSRHMRQPVQMSNVFILRSGKVVTDWIDPDDPIQVSLFGAAIGQHVTQDEADLLVLAGFAANLVKCPELVGAGWDTGGWDLGGWDS